VKTKALFGLFLAFGLAVVGLAAWQYSKGATGTDALASACASNEALTAKALWPASVRDLEASPLPPLPALPAFFTEMPAKALPVTLTHRLADLAADQLVDAINLPDHHRDALPDRLTTLPAYTGFDATFALGDQNIPVRVVFNSGDGDSNDGFWGAVWCKSSGKKLVDLISSGDMQTTFTAVAQPEIDQFEAKAQPLDMPPQDPEAGYEFIFSPEALKAAKNLALERDARLAVMLFRANY
jgi:hypothetical protein